MTGMRTTIEIVCMGVCCEVFCNEYVKILGYTGQNTAIKYRYRAGSEAATEQKQREKETNHGKSNKN